MQEDGAGKLTDLENLWQSSLGDSGLADRVLGGGDTPVGADVSGAIVDEGVVDGGGEMTQTNVADVVSSPVGGGGATVEGTSIVQGGGAASSDDAVQLDFAMALQSLQNPNILGIQQMEASTQLSTEVADGPGEGLRGR